MNSTEACAVSGNDDPRGKSRQGIAGLNKERFKSWPIEIEATKNSVDLVHPGVSDPLVLDDQAVVVHVQEKGLVVTTGCGHAGIVNIVRYAQKLTLRHGRNARWPYCKYAYV